MRLPYGIILLSFTLISCTIVLAQEEHPGTNTAIISLFFRPLNPHVEKEIARQELQELLGEESATNMPKQERSETKASSPATNKVPFLQGIYVSYQGMVATSDYNGQVVFPNHQAKPTLTVVVTDSLTPIIIFSNTVQHMKVREGHEAIFYEVTRERNQKLKKFVWNIRVIPTPANGRIPDDALLISAQPSQIVIPEGTTITEQDVNLLLPPVYLRSSITATDNALQFMKMAKFYAPVEKTTSYASDRYATMINR